jgi:hypothetical protein
MGNIKDAYAFIQLAKADADFYGARQRKIQIGAILPLVAAEELSHSEKEKQTILGIPAGYYSVSIAGYFVFDNDIQAIR